MVESSRHTANNATIIPNERTIYTAIRAWLTSVLCDIAPQNILLGPINRMASPQHAFCSMVITGRKRLATNSWRYNGIDAREILAPSQITLRLSFFGETAASSMQTVAALWRDLGAIAFFRANYPGMAPLCVSEVAQSNFVNAEQQYEDLWALDITMQVNFVIVRPQDFARTLSVSTSSV